MRIEPRKTEAEAGSTDVAGTRGGQGGRRARRGPQSLRGFWRRDEGAFTMMFAVLGGILIGTMCLGIDSIRFTMSQTQMQMALDVAALSSGADLVHYSDTNGNNYTQWQADALAYYQGNMPSSYLGMTRQPITATVTGDRASGQTINLSTSSKQPLLAPFFLDPTVSKNAASGTNGGGVGDPRTFATVSAANSVIRLPQTLLELSLVLDNTGSMSQSADGTSGGASKLAGLQYASGRLLTALYNQSNSSNTTYVGLVPFASTVNLTGALSGSGSWMNPVFTYNSSNVGMKKSGTVAGWGGCAVEPRDAGNNLQPLAYSPSMALKFTPYYYNVPTAGLVIRGSKTTSSMCPTSRNSYVTATDTAVPVTIVSSPLGAQNWCNTSPIGTGLDVEYDQYDPATFTKVGSTKVTTTTVDQNAQCMGQPVTFLTNQVNTLNTAINNMVAGGSTIIPEGLLWGWRMLVPEWSSNIAGAANGWISTDPSLPKPLTTQGLQRVMIVLTDGENQIGAAGSFPNTLWFNGLSGVGTNSLKATSIGLPNGQTDSAELHGGNPVDASSGNNAGYPDDVNTFQNAVCTAIKNDNVTIYAITFGSDASNSVAQTAMRNCASPGDYYHAPDNTSLDTIFQQIAGNLGELRLTK